MTELGNRDGVHNLNSTNTVILLVLFCFFTWRKAHDVEYSVQLVMVIRVTSLDVLLSTVKDWL